eukprot:359367-Chlamydomonas_euryale.AAC.4
MSALRRTNSFRMSALGRSYRRRNICAGSGQPGSWVKGAVTARPPVVGRTRPARSRALAVKTLFCAPASRRRLHARFHCSAGGMLVRCGQGAAAARAGCSARPQCVGTHKMSTPGLNPLITN